MKEPILSRPITFNIMATARFAHYLKVIGRDKIGSFMEAEDCEKWLNRHFSQSSASMKEPILSRPITFR
jgi:predicted component of type VI protein secretion system